MATYLYKAVTRNGEVLEGEADAVSKEELVERLQSAGHIPLSASEKKSQREFIPLKLKDLFRRAQISNQAIVFFTRQLATLLQAGLPLDHALRTLSGLCPQGPLKNMVDDLHTQLRRGVGMADAMAAQEGIFNKFYLHTVRAGEAGGALHIVLDRLADYLERNAELRSDVLSALLYPFILFTVAVISLLIMVIFVVPEFSALFEDSGQPLPLLTLIIFGITDFIRYYYWLILLLVLAAVFFAHQWWQQNRLRWDQWSLAMPLYGELIAKLEVARFSRTLGTLLSNGVPLLNATVIVKETLRNQVLSNTVADAIKALEQGRGLSGVLVQSGHFPELAVQLIRVGEEAGNIESMLMKTADIYEQESKATIKRLLIILEPALIIGLGTMIAIIISSILVAILGLNELIV